MTDIIKLKIEYDTKYSPEDVLKNVMGNIDIGLYEKIGIRFKVESRLAKKYNAMYH